MPISPQPRGARGTVEHPYSALNLRLILAGFGLASCAVLAGLSFSLGYPVVGVIAVVFAVVAIIDLIVIQRRRRQRRRVDALDHSLFE
jgi:hypothetical protein